MTDIEWGELKPASEEINTLLIKFRADATKQGIPINDVTLFLTSIMHLIINVDRAVELESRLNEKLSAWKKG